MDQKDNYLNEIWVRLNDNEPCFRGLKTQADIELGLGWNGFETPLFTRDEADRILNHMTSADPSQYEWVFLESEDCYMITHPDNVDSGIDVYTGREVYDPDSGTDVILYPLGAFAWTWELADEDSVDIEIARRWLAKVEAQEIAALANPDGLGRIDVDDYRARMGFD